MCEVYVCEVSVRCEVHMWCVCEVEWVGFVYVGGDACILFVH